MAEKKERAARFYISAKDHTDPLVTIAKDTEEAVAKWTKRTGRDAKDAVVTPLGTLAESIRDRMLGEPYGSGPELKGTTGQPAKKTRETKG